MNKFEFNKLCPFKWFVLENFPFIEADFDAITNYQLYCKVVEYLNKVIENNNAIGIQTENLTDAFIELQNYVNNYFDNLDVQEEINNKLDDMVEDGILQEIIADYLNSKAIFGFDNVNAMKNATNLIDGSYAQTLGYYSKNDGGKALYKIREISNNDVVDEMTILALNNDNTLIAELILEETINPKCLGTKGDGINNDNPYIQKAISLGNIKLDKGIYFIESTLNIPSDLIFDGNESTIKPDNGITAFSIIGNGINNSVVNTYLKNIKIDTQNQGSNGIYLKDGYFNYFDNINISRLKGENTYGFKIVNGFNHVISNSRVIGNLSNGQIGIDISSTSNNDSIENMTNCKYQNLLLQNTQYGVKTNYLTTANMVEFNNIGFSSCNYAFYLTGYALPVTIRNSRIEVGNAEWDTYGIYQNGNIHSFIDSLNVYDIKYPIYNESEIDINLTGELCFTGTNKTNKYTCITSNGNVCINTHPYVLSVTYNFISNSSLASSKYLANSANFINIGNTISSDNTTPSAPGNKIFKLTNRVFNLYGVRGLELLVYAEDTGYVLQSSSNGSTTSAFTGSNITVEPFKFYRIKFIDANKWTVLV